MIEIKRKPIYAFVKRSFDIISSFLFLVCFSWLILILLFIKFCEDGHCPVYTSIRIGKDGKKIKFHKIRSMVPGAERMKKTLKDMGKNETNGPAFKMKDDPRITKFGRFLRKSSLDEILQVWDIFVGRLSVVGPRSPLPDEVEEYNEYQMQRLKVKGGLLCYWQIQDKRHDLSFDEWVELDLKYIKERSFLTDFKIIVKGLWFVITNHSGE